MLGLVADSHNLTDPASRFRYSREQLELRGRWRSLVRAFWVVVVLIALRQPPYLVATGVLDVRPVLRAEVADTVAARMCLLVEVLLIGGYVLLAFRALEYLRACEAFRPVAPKRSTRQSRTYRLGRTAVYVVLVGAILDVVENVVLWRANGTPPADLHVPVLSLVVLVLVIGGLFLAGYLVVQAQRRSSRRRAPLRPSDHVRPATTDLAICCSGGGVRSATFCLGGLQVLSTKNIYSRADLVVGVSGGGYIAAAHHIVRWQSDGEHVDAGQGEDDAEDDAVGPGWPDLASLPAFAPDSPEQRWLRRNTRFLLSSPRVALQGLLSLFFGIAVNLLLLFAALGATAWWLGWFLSASGGLKYWSLTHAEGGSYTGDWRFVAFVWVLPAAGVALFVFEKLYDKFRTLQHGVRDTMRLVSSLLIIYGSAAVVLLIGVPALLAAMHNFAATSDSALAGLLHALGFVPDEVCTARLAVDDLPTCGTSKSSDLEGEGNALLVSAGSLTAIVASVLAVVRTARSNLGASQTDAVGKPLRQLGSKVWDKVKTVVIPWTASVVVLLALAVFLLRWVAALVDDPEDISSWGLAATFGLLLLAIRLLTDANRTSLHHFYRERLSTAFLVRRRRGGVDPIEYYRPVRYSESRPPPGRGPRLVACAAANVSADDVVPAERGCVPFVFSDHRIGLTDETLPSGAALTPSNLYEYQADRLYRDATIPAAMAISGAAFSPLAGRENLRLGPFRFVLALANARLGVWLPNPLWINDVEVARKTVKTRDADAARVGWHSLNKRQQRELCVKWLTRDDELWLQSVVLGESAPEPGWPQRARTAYWTARHVVTNTMTKPGPFRLLKEAVGRTSVFDRKLYVTDGGHYENLGLVEALRHRPKEVIVLDASSDAEDSFSVLGRAIATARMDLDCEVTFDPRNMRRLTAERAEAAWGEGIIRYADGSPGTLYVAKVVLAGELPWDVETYAAKNPAFPRTGTADQLYGEFDLEAYRVLGREVTLRMVEEFELASDPPKEPDPSESVP